MTKSLAKVNQRELFRMLDLRPNTPPGESNGVSIIHNTIPPGEKVPVISMRNAILMQQQPTQINFDQPFTIRTLKEEDHGCWMTDSPQEVWQMRDAWKHAWGDVLIGGMGLGVISSLIANKSKVSNVTTVERSQDVLSLTQPYLRRPHKHTVVCADLFKWLDNLRVVDLPYDLGIFDIWQGTGESTWVEYIVPLRRKARGKINRLLCWNEAEMQGQLWNSLRKNVLAKEDVKLWAPHEVFRKVAAQHHDIEPTWGMDDLKNATSKFIELTTSPPRTPKTEALISCYLSPGTESWERLFADAWDELIPSKADL